LNEGDVTNEHIESISELGFDAQKERPQSYGKHEPEVSKILAVAGPELGDRSRLLTAAGGRSKMLEDRLNQAQKLINSFKTNATTHRPTVSLSTNNRPPTSQNAQ